MLATLLLLPNLWGCESLETVKDAGAVVLDDLIGVGFAGVFFRRLRVSVVLGQTRRSVYDQLRRDYLKFALSVISKVEGNVVFVGTSPSDADLIEFDSVHAVRFAESSMRALSKSVYGDGVMLTVEYASVLDVAAQSIDHWHDLRQWSDLHVMFAREFRRMVGTDWSVSPSAQRTKLAGLAVTAGLTHVWLEDEIRLDFPIGRGFMVADYDYLGAVKPIWRDAVVRALGRAPSIERVFRLPWFVVDVQAFGVLCFRADINGLPAVSMRGDSLVSFVRSRLSSVFTARELVGTWIGSLLADDNLAVEVMRVSSSQPLLSSGSARHLEVSEGSAECLKVPREFGWMYDAVPGVAVADWDGPRAVSGVPAVPHDVPVGWEPSAHIAQFFSGMDNSERSAVAVVTAVRQMQILADSGALRRRVADMARRVYHEGSAFDEGDRHYMSLMPGYQYLSVVPTMLRVVVSRMMGAYPAPDLLYRYLPPESGSSKVYGTELWADAARSCVFSGLPLHELNRGADALVLDASSDDSLLPGKCYLSLFKRDKWDDAMDLLGYYPMLSTVMSAPADWKLDDWTGRVHVRFLSGYIPVPKDAGFTLAHLSFESEGPLLSDFLDDPTQYWHGHDRLRVGYVLPPELLKESGSGVSVTSPSNRGYCNVCHCNVVMYGHEQRCRIPTQGWSEKRHKSWYGDTVLRMDVQLAIRFRAIRGEDMERYLQCYVTTKALYKYVMEHTLIRVDGGAKAHATEFESLYHGEVRESFLSFHFPEVYDKILAAWEPPALI